ncbi:MAG: right-handed parallel beta-helix repeat-containing protein [Planctomycetota bacterium]
MNLRSLVVVLVLLAAAAARGETYYVNNKAGNDENDGLSAEKAFATIARAIKTCKTSDTLSLANTGTPYREPIPLANLGGTPAKPFVIEGNGAVISGLREIKPEQWTKNGDVYEIKGEKPYGFPSLLIDGKETPPGDPAKLEPGQWAWPKDPEKKTAGTLRFRPEAGKTPADYKLEATLEVSGFRVASSSYIVVKDLVSEWHSNDGFNIHGDCRGIYCENIEGRFNGDDGFSIHEAIEAVVRNGHFHHNGSGIEDVNLSRSFYSGLRVHDNRRLGVLLIGAFHSAVDAVVYDNPFNFKLTPGATKHLVGGEQSPIRDTSVYLQNVVAWGGEYGVQATGGARAMIVNCIFADSKVGIEMTGESRVNLTKSIVANCGDVELGCKGKEFFGDYNVYFPGRFLVGAQKFMPEQWDDFRKAVGYNENSLLQDPKLSEGQRLTEESPKAIGKYSIGPTAFYVGQMGD